MENTVYYKKGSENEIAFVFSCPGKVEKDSVPPEPAKGETGNNLDMVIELLSTEYGRNEISRTKATIANSWSNVEFYSNGGTGRSEAKIEEVMDVENLNRLADEIEGIEKYIFACGINAKATVMTLKYGQKLNQNVKVFGLRHLGNQSINKIDTDKDGQHIYVYKTAGKMPKSEKRTFADIKRDNKKRRLEKVAFDLNGDICKGKSL
jgi:hypothetical protein